ncbi:DnaB-like dsDNA helicase [Rhodococcus phage Partridge]|uniref:DnaB-like dsDNA helicase n=2 Tax=Rhodococcus virus Takoda TaxID=2846062 RepID=A0A6G6XS56_9CAUD|nr:DnaB-like dsDNA helicase [Rhodococcus phage Partridge]QIG61662.1 DnaB-like dsDNA helicase [Rhodococcus phage Dinger]
MHTLLQSATVRGKAGQPLPAVWSSLGQKGTLFRRGQLSLVAAGPGVGKSAFILNYALKARVATLYFSADSDAFVQLTRSVSILADKHVKESTKLVIEDRLDEVSEELSSVPIRFNYSSSPTIQIIEDEVESYFETYGDFPDLIVIDNVLDVLIGGSEEGGYSGLEDLMSYLHDMARLTESCVVGLHHVTGTYNDADKPIPLSGVKGQITRVPEMVLTLHKQSSEYGPDTICVSTVKNRAEKADPSGNDIVELDFQGEYMNITDAQDSTSRAPGDEPEDESDSYQPNTTPSIWD